MKNSTVSIWVARLRTDDGIETTAWAHRDGATGWIEHNCSDAVTWTERGNEGQAGESAITGDPVGTVREAEVQNPVKLSEKFPDELVSPRFIRSDESK